MTEPLFEDVLDEALARLLAGEATDDILRSYPQHANALRPALQSAVRIAALVPDPTDAARASALHGMLASIEATKSAGAALASEFGGTAMIMAWFKKRPFAYASMAGVASIALLGGVAAGASAAGAGPEPVREFFGFQSDSSIRVEFDGLIAGINDVDGELTVQTGSDVRTVIVTGATDLSDGGAAIAFGDLAVGDPVEVKGTLQLDNTILASRVHREDSLDDDEAAPGNATPAPNATPDDEDDDVDDNSGPGSADDDGEVDDVDDDEVDDADDGNSGEGSDDDEISEDSAGPGGAEDDELDDDSSGPGGADDDQLDDDSSGSGSGDDDLLDDDSSDSGRGDDDELDDDSPDSGSDVGPDDD